MKKRWLSVLSVLMLASILTCSGCSGQGNNNSSQSGNEDTIVKIRIFAAEYPDPAYPRRWDQVGMANIRKIAQERFKIDLELEEVIGSSDYIKSILNTRFAAKADLPDVVRFDFSTAELNQLYRNGHILNMSKYPQSIPNVIETFEQIPSLMLANCTPEGDILRIPQVSYNIQHVSVWTHIRRDWLNALGLPVPTTTEEFRNTLRAFQQNDMNKNGKKDEVFVANFESMNTVLAPAFGALGITVAANSWYADDNGKVYHAMLTDNARRYVEYVASMFSEGLFWPGSFSGDATQSMALLNSNCRAGQFGRYWNSLIDNIDGFSRGRPDEYNPILPLSDGTNPARIMIKNYAGQSCNMLTSACKVPERVLAFYDWCLTKEANDIIYLGEPLSNSKYYREVPVKDLLDPDIVKRLNIGDNEMTTELTEEGKALAARERNISGYLGANNDLWPMKAINNAKEIAIDFYTSYMRNATRSASDIEMNYNLLSWPNGEGHSFYDLPLAVMTEEQSEVITRYGDLFVYMNEMYQKFMTGVEPMSKWDEFVNQCKKQGLDEVLKVQQARYDAVKK